MKKLIILAIEIAMLVNVGIASAASNADLEKRIDELEIQVADLQEALVALQEAKTISKTLIQSGVNFGSGSGPGSSSSGMGTAGF
ncbi:MAG: hypothetical protein ABH868_06715 [bacterium]